jgi:lysophospholipase L1-like esterase
MILNIVLISMIVEQYRAEQRLRLDPTTAAMYGAGQNMAESTETATALRRIVLFGDSRILQWTSFPKPTGVEVLNRGVRSETTAQALVRLDRDVLDLQPDLVVIQIGVNDLKTIGVLPDQADQIELDCVTNIESIIKQITDSRCDVLLLTIFPTGTVPLHRKLIWSDRTIDAIDRVNNQLLWMDSPHVHVLDCDTILRKGRRIRSEFAIDALHLSKPGYVALNNKVEPLAGTLLERNTQSSK